MNADDPIRLTISHFNHIGITVDDLEETEARVKALGIKTHSHADYESGKRFYYADPSGFEVEVVSYNGD